MMHVHSQSDVRDVAAHAGGTSPGVGRHDSGEAGRPAADAASPARSPARPRASSLVRKVASVAAGMVGLALIGFVAGAPKSDRVELMSVAPNWGEEWLAGAAPSASATLSATARERVEPVNPAPASAAGASASAPMASESAPGASASAAPSSPAAPVSGVTADGKVILNRASATELRRLPGVGQKRAEKIVELRSKLGRFSKPSELLRVKGIGPKGLQKMLPYLVLDAEPEPGRPAQK